MSLSAGCPRFPAYLALAVLLGLPACRPRTPAAADCPPWPVRHAPTDVFDLRPDVQRESASAADDTLPGLPFAQRQAMLHDTQADCCRLDSGRFDTTYVHAHGYATVARLRRAAGAPCHLLARVSTDDFEGLYLVLRAPDGRYANLYVAGLDGSAGTDGGYYHSWATTIGRMLNDSLLQVKTGSQHLAFRASGKQSYADSTTEVFRLRYGPATIQRVSSRTTHPKLPGEYFD